MFCPGRPLSANIVNITAGISGKKSLRVRARLRALRSGVRDESARTIRAGRAVTLQGVQTWSTDPLRESLAPD